MSRLAKGLLLAPLSALLLLVFALLQIQIESTDKLAFTILFLCALILVPWYITALAVLLPIHLVLRRIGVSGLVAYQLIFVIANAVFSAVFFSLPQSFTELNVGSTNSSRMLEGFVALAIATVFWLIAVRNSTRDS